MRWKSNIWEGWFTAFAWLPVVLDDGTTVFWEPFRFYVNRFGIVTTRIK